MGTQPLAPTRVTVRGATVLLLGWMLGASIVAQTRTPPANTFAPGQTPWGDPDSAGVYTNNDESLIPFERPAKFDGRRIEDITEAELEQLRDERSDERNEADRNRADLRSPIHWFENHFPNNSRPWLVTDPPDGHVPGLTAEGRQRAAARAAALKGRGPADSAADRSLWDRCITRGIPGSMMPGVYGNNYEIVQGPVSVTPAVTGRGRRWWSRPPTSPTRPRIAGRAST
jgi:hypothetical protein